MDFHSLNKGNWGIRFVVIMEILFVHHMPSLNVIISA